jgi:hypothetical protein
MKRHGRLRHPRLMPASSLLALAISGTVHAQAAPTQSVWGGVGLLQNPSARMAEDGGFSFVASHTSPYSRYNFSLQPFPWLEASFRYVNVAGVPYGSANIDDNQNLKDKSVDFKLRLWEESHWVPEIAFGMRDIGGTGLFSSEYLVASKRFGQFDATLGFATGYLGSNGDFSNPLGWIDDRFKTRPGIQQAGDFNSNVAFRGPVGVFGGVAWQTPWEPLQVKLEYDGHDYDQEPRHVPLPQDSRFNLGLHYRVSPGIQLMLGWERGNELSAALTLGSNLAQRQRQPRLLDPPREPLRPRGETAATEVATAGTGTATSGAGAGVDTVAQQAPDLRATPAPAPASIATTPDPASPAGPASPPGPAPAVAPIDSVLRPGEDWTDVSRRLSDNAGIEVQDIAVSGRELIVRGEQRRFFFPAEGLDRAARIVGNAAGPGIDWVTLEHTRQGLPVAQSSVSLQALRDHERGDIDLDTLARSIELNPPGSSREGTVVHREPLQRFDSGLSPGWKQIIGGPDGFILYQLTADWDARWRFSRGTWLSATVSANLLDNFDKFKYDAPSNLPRVRTDVRQYVTTADVTIPNLQLTHTRALGRDLYGMAYAGLFESMYGGVGGELLYRPFGEPWAVGVEANWVKQRDFDQRFDFRDYEVGTGHATVYYRFGRQQRVQAALAAGRYLAGDWGATLDLSRVFANGVVMGAWATKTDVSAEEFGEGSFDKGIYVSVPMDFLLPRSSRSRANLVWHPLVRDGGARLVRRYTLYGLTDERDPDLLFNNLNLLAP